MATALLRSGRLLLALVVLAACSHPSPSPSAGDDPEKGDHLYVRLCATCHGIDGRGGGPVASSLRVAPADLTRLAADHGGEFPRAYVIDVITGLQPLPAHGTREMPVWSDRFGSGPGYVASAYARRRIELLADYLAALQR